jgi:cytochrome o ubiquinol oxidase subunit II
VVGAAVSLASCQRAGILDPQGPIASAERLLLINSTAIMLVVVVPMIVATLVFRLVVPVIQHPRQSWHGRIL